MFLFRRHQAQRYLWVAVRLVLRLAAIGAILTFVGLDVRRHLERTRGLEDGLSPAQPPVSQPRFGVNVSLERYHDDDSLRRVLEIVRNTGFGAVRQRFSWAEIEPAPGEYHWEGWDRALPILSEYGLQMIAVLDTSPAWARPSSEASNPYAPPDSVEDYAHFVRAFAERYGHWVTAYQVWDEPNIAPHWGAGPIDPAAYVRLLRAASTAIRGADSHALIIAGSLAPSLEPGGLNMSDVLFLREIYRRGAGAYFDILGAKPYGFWSGPDDRRVSPKVLNFSRVILLREEMVRRGEAHKPIWALESGWCVLPENWQGEASPQGCDQQFIQEERLGRAILRVQQEWPWMGLMCVAFLQPRAPIDNPVWGYALLRPDGGAQPMLAYLRQRLGGEPVFYPGRTTNPQTFLQLQAANSELTDLHFWGTDLLLEVGKGVASGQLTVSVDAQQADVVVDLAADAPRLERVRMGSRVPLAVHRVRLRGTADQVATLRAVQVGHRPSYVSLWVNLLGSFLVLAWCAIPAWYAARLIPWRRIGQRLRALWLALPCWVQVAMVALPWPMILLSTSSALRLAAMVAYMCGALLRPDLALYVAVAIIPLAPVYVRLGPGAFSVAEMALLVAAFARLGELLLQPPVPRKARTREGYWAQVIPLQLARWSLLDWAVLLMVLLGLGTSLVAEYQREALRELRTVVGEGALLYLLLRTQPGDRHKLLRLADVLWLSGVGVALYALARYRLPEGVIEAEGVRRARAFYGSPNNLALYMERILPIGLAVVAWGRERWRRGVYGLGVIPVSLALFLSFSRGAWFFGVPAMLLVLSWVRGGRVRWVAIILLGVSILVLVPLAGTERLASLFDPSRGTSFIRLGLWQAAWDMVRDHPLLGVGLDNFLYYYGDYIRPGAEVDRWLSHPHQWVLDFWLRLGIGGLALILVLLVGFWRRALRAYRALPEGDLRAITLGLMAGMATFVAHGTIDASFFIAELAYWFMFALAWVGAMEKKVE